MFEDAAPVTRLADEVRNSEGMLSKYWRAGRTPLDFENLKTPMRLAFSELDFFLSLRSAATGAPIYNLISRVFKGDLEAYMQQSLRMGYLGRFGASIDPSSTLLNYPRQNISLLWIPKNSNTTLKRILTQAELGKDSAAFDTTHSGIQDQFGVTPSQFTAGEVLPRTCVIREPHERLVSCYLDKVARPILKGRDFEPFMIGPIRTAQEAMGIKFDLHRSLTFNEFKDFILRTPAWRLNPHWRPQAHFLPSDRSEIRFATVDDLVRYFSMVGLPYEPQRFNRLFGGTMGEIGEGEFGDTLPASLPQDDLADYSHFISSQSSRDLAEYLSEDFRLYELAQASDA